MNNHEKYMHRCLALAVLSNGNEAPNPMVGAVLVHNNTIIGEGFHEQYGQAHAEVNCINSVAPKHQYLIAASTLYVSLEPCAHHGKTPPCAQLIIERNIKTVVVGVRDPFSEVDGKGIELLEQAGVQVIVGVLEDECRTINKRFFTQHTLFRPYITLKLAQTHDGFMAHTAENSERLIISSPLTDRLVHKWRSQAMGILVGTITAYVDNPLLNNRYWTGKNPVRMVVDNELRLPEDLHLFDGKVPTIVFHSNKIVPDVDAFHPSIEFYPVHDMGPVLLQIALACHEQNIHSLLVEGGAALITSFIRENVWDELHIITNNNLAIGDGLAAPLPSGLVPTNTLTLGNDTITTYTNLTPFAFH